MTLHIILPLSQLCHHIVHKKRLNFDILPPELRDYQFRYEEAIIKCRMFRWSLHVQKRDYSNYTAIKEDSVRFYHARNDMESTLIVERVGGGICITMRIDGSRIADVRISGDARFEDNNFIFIDEEVRILLPSHRVICSFGKKRAEEFKRVIYNQFFALR